MPWRLHFPAGRDFTLIRDGGTATVYRTTVSGCSRRAGFRRGNRVVHLRVEGVYVAGAPAGKVMTTPSPETLRDRVARHLLETDVRPRCLHCLATEIGLSYRQVHTALRGTNGQDIVRHYGQCSGCGRSRLLVSGRT